MEASSHSAPPGEALGQSESFLAFQEALSRAAKVDRPVLLVGERGTGKELAAARLHYLSPRWGEPLVALNCAALAPSLIESELFGHEAGAFTGAGQRRLGRFETAHQGTLFLDEIGNIPLTVQEKILRTVEYGSFERVGGSRPVEVDVRIVGATNADLPAMARAGRFKQDLLDRLSFEVLTLPPLRTRQGDALLLAEHFAQRMAGEMGWGGPPGFSPAVREQLAAHAWPGNVRQLKNVVERAVYRSGGREITSFDFDPFASPFAPLPPEKASRQKAPPDAPPSASPLPFKQAVADYERRLVKQALDAARFNQRQAADLLGLTYHQLRGLLRKHGPMDKF
ncbi:MAG: phage shock protein operon transcriptional activator [Desulfarculaceae bacterium]|nr:phage shock protein operon transcriptional activator [Desulfarculaceae bacterium]MCF8048123.1 phage shock protein operon transcriptional activator [Desulfarculaceae bacterium]MCF8064758.1 phage shock protein operon transcriptional activator [Desulfarculaceae bacterium]MCF8099309.1 phage shock protein operon transcriptional activator [Desulfarculaceae bacterium]MCF8123091.1 phage shock protein operon transcriptional activator [Desulfarculaceae bacterium]